MNELDLLWTVGRVVGNEGSRVASAQESVVY